MDKDDFSKLVNFENMNKLIYVKNAETAFQIHRQFT